MGPLQFECPPADPTSLQKNGDNGGEVTNQKVALWPKRGQEPLKEEGDPQEGPPKYLRTSKLPFFVTPSCLGGSTGAMRPDWPTCGRANRKPRKDGRGEWIPKGQISFLPLASVAVFSPVDGDLAEFKGEKCNSMSPAPPGTGRGSLATFCRISTQTVTAFMKAVFISIPILRRLCFQIICLPLNSSGAPALKCS